MISLGQRLKIAVGIGVCSYEAAALAVGDRHALPAISDLCRPDPDDHTHNLWRVLLGIAITTWIADHLLRPWLQR